MGAQPKIKPAARAAAKPKLTVVPPTTITAQVIDAVTRAGSRGLTSTEVTTLIGKDHSRVSGRLSDKHREGDLALLDRKRNGQRIYVLANLANKRPISAYRPNKHTKERAVANFKNELTNVIVAAADSRGKVSAQLVIDAMDNIVT